MSINAVERALIILKQMAFSPDGVSVREMARQLGVSPSVVQKSLQALVVQGFAQQDPVTQHYHLGPVAIQVGLAGLARLEIREVARPYLQTLAESSGETTFLGIRQGNMVVYIEKVLSRAEIRLDVPIGSRRPLNCTAVGKALLAYLPEEEMERLAEEGAFVRSTPNSITDPEQLKREMALVRKRGFAVDREEFASGTMCLAAPVWDYEGNVVASVTMSGPVQRVQPQEEELARQVIECAGAISSALGYRFNSTPLAAGR